MRFGTYVKCFHSIKYISKFLLTRGSAVRCKRNFRKRKHSPFFRFALLKITILISIFLLFKDNFYVLHWSVHIRRKIFIYSLLDCLFVELPDLFFFIAHLRLSLFSHCMYTISLISAPFTCILWHTHTRIRLLAIVFISIPYYFYWKLKQR